MNKPRQSQGLYYFAALEDKLAELAARGIVPTRLDVGSPDLAPPDDVIETLYHAARDPAAHGYQSHKGTPALRRAWADFYQRNFGVGLDPDREVLPLIGSKEGIFHALQAWLAPGDGVLLPDPGYVTYKRGALAAGGQVISYTLDEGDEYLPQLDRIPASALQSARVLWINYPNNPTGGSISLGRMEQIVDFARSHKLLLCHDAAYTLVTYDGYQAPSILQAAPDLRGVVEFNSLSKTYNMAGWRSGVLVGDPDAVQAVYKYKTDVDSGLFLPIMQASIQAMNTDPAWVQERNQVYRRRRDIVMRALTDAGLDALSPKGAIYIWSRIPGPWSSQEFALKMLEEAAVSITPGDTYGDAGEGYFRISLTADAAEIEAAMQRFVNWVR